MHSSYLEAETTLLHSYFEPEKLFCNYLEIEKKVHKSLEQEIRQ